MSIQNYCRELHFQTRLDVANQDEPRYSCFLLIFWKEKKSEKSLIERFVMNHISGCSFPLSKLFGHSIASPVSSSYKTSMVWIPVVFPMLDIIWMKGRCTFIRFE